MFILFIQFGLLHNTWKIKMLPTIFFFKTPFSFWFMAVTLLFPKQLSKYSEAWIARRKLFSLFMTKQKQNRKAVAEKWFLCKNTSPLRPPYNPFSQLQSKVSEAKWWLNKMRVFGKHKRKEEILKEGQPKKLVILKSPLTLKKRHSSFLTLHWSNHVNFFSNYTHCLLSHAYLFFKVSISAYSENHWTYWINFCPLLL